MKIDIPDELAKTYQDARRVSMEFQKERDILDDEYIQAGESKNYDKRIKVCERSNDLYRRISNARHIEVSARAKIDDIVTKLLEPAK